MIYMPKKKTTLIRAPDFKTIYAVGAIGNWTPYDFRINFYSEKVMEDEEEAYVNNSQIILSPQATKEFALWLMQNVKDYEATYGATKTDTNNINSTREDAKFISDLRTDMKNDIKGELKADLEKTVIENIKNELKNNLGQEIKNDIRKYMKQNLQGDLSRNLRVLPSPELKKDLKKVLKADLKQDLHKDMRPELRKDLKRVLKDDLKQDLREDIRKDLERELQKNLHVGKGGTQKLKTKTKTHMESVKSSAKGKVGKKTTKLRGKKK